MKLVVCFVAVAVMTGVHAAFDCRREAGLCNGGTCIADGTKCQPCPTGKSGYDCSLTTADVGANGCSVKPCKNGGTCHMANGAATFTCLCTGRFTGATCTEERYSVGCNVDGSDTMTMTIIPPVSSFTGVIYVKDKYATCKFPTTAPFKLTGLSNTDTNCGSTSPITTGGVTRQQRIVIVQYIAEYLTERDEVVTFTCGSGDTITKSPGAVAITQLDQHLHGEADGNVPLDGDVSFVLTKSSVVISAAVNIGEKITVTADITANGLLKYPAIRLKSCSASNKASSTDPGYVSRKFVDNYCVHNDLRSIMSGLTRTGNKVEFTFNAFKFISPAPSTNIYVTCDVEVCTTTAACNPETCDSNTGFGRKKRDTGNVEKTLQRYLIINDPLGDASADALKEKERNEACYQSSEMTAAVIALAVALLLVLLLCTVLIVKAILNRRTTTVYREESSETTSTANFPHLPTIVSNKT